MKLSLFIFLSIFFISCSKTKEGSSKVQTQLSFSKFGVIQEIYLKLTNKDTNQSYIEPLGESGEAYIPFGRWDILVVASKGAPLGVESAVCGRSLNNTFSEEESFIDILVTDDICYEEDLKTFLYEILDYKENNDITDSTNNNDSTADDQTNVDSPIVYTYHPITTGQTVKIEVTSDGKLGYTYDTTNFAVLEIDLSTGLRRYITNNTNQYLGPAFPTNINTLALSQDEKKIYMTSSIGVLEIDILTGQKTIINGSIISGYEDLHHAGNSLYLLSSTMVQKLDLISNSVTEVSSGTVGTGDPITSLEAIEVTNDEAVIYVQGFDLYKIDPNTGDRVIIASSSVGTGASWATGGDGLALNKDETHAFARSATRITSINLTDLSRTIISDNGLGAGPILTGTTISLDVSDSGQLYIMGNVQEGLVTVNPSTGDRTRLYDQKTSNGVIGSYSGTQLNINKHTGELLFSGFQSTNKLFFKIDKNTGDKVDLFTQASLNVTPNIQGSAYLSDSSRYYIIGTNSVTELNSNNDVATVLSTSGLALSNCSSGEVDSTDTNLYIFCNSMVAKMDLTTKVITEVSSSGVGTGPMWGAYSFKPVLTSDDSTIYIPDLTNDAILKIDTTTGDRTVISSSGIGTGDVFYTPSSLALSSDEQTLYMIESGLGHVMSIDVNTGDRQILVDGSLSNGPRISYNTSPAHKMTYDSSENVIYYYDNNYVAIMKIDLNTKTRTLFAKW